MDRTWAEILVVYLVMIAATRAVLMMPGVVELPRWRLLPRVRRRATLGPPPRRPIETVVADLRRLGGRYHHPPRGSSNTKLQALQFAYDRALAEACACLDIDHLLTVLEPGGELDLERKRVEDALWLVGVRLEPA